MSKKKKQLDLRKICWSLGSAAVFFVLFWWGANYGPRFYANNENFWLVIAMIVGAVGVCGLIADLLYLGFKPRTAVCLLLALALLTAFRITILVMVVVYLAFVIYGLLKKALS